MKDNTLMSLKILCSPGLSIFFFLFSALKKRFFFISLLQLTVSVAGQTHNREERVFECMEPLKWSDKCDVFLCGKETPRLDFYLVLLYPQN